MHGQASSEALIYASELLHPALCVLDGRAISAQCILHCDLEWRCCAALSDWSTGQDWTGMQHRPGPGGHRRRYNLKHHAPAPTAACGAASCHYRRHGHQQQQKQQLHHHHHHHHHRPRDRASTSRGARPSCQPECAGMSRLAPPAGRVDAKRILMPRAVVCASMG
jgi:hypothetical protein